MKWLVIDTIWKNSFRNLKRNYDNKIKFAIQYFRPVANQKNINN